jgi:hypothetical protein
MKMKMEFCLAIIPLLISACCASVINNPSTIFEIADEYQPKVTSLQQEIIDEINEWRSTMTEVLKETSNSTLTQTHLNYYSLLAMDELVRELIFVELNNTGSCVQNLRNRLGLLTDFSGFKSGICLRRYDRNVTEIVNVVYDALEKYESAIAIIQTVVVNAFTSRNIWREKDLIQNEIEDAYNSYKDEWERTVVLIANYLLTFKSNIIIQNEVLVECFAEVYAEYEPQYAMLVRDAEVCREW